MAQHQKNKINRVLFAVAGISLAFGVFGSVTGVYAWYQYSTRAGLNYYGTTVGDTEKLTVGLVSDSVLAGYADMHSLIEDKTSIANKVVYWSLESGLSSDAVLDFEKRLGYAGNEITAVSSGSYSTGDDFSLYRAPSYMAHEEFQKAYKHTYTYLPMAFKSGVGAGVTQNLMLTNSNIQCQNEVITGVRVAFMDPTKSGSSLLYRPAGNSDGEVAVGGLLNLNSKNDIYYDYDPYTKKEHAYGEFVTYSYQSEKYDGHIDYPTEQVTTFHANHKEGLNKITYTPKTAQYLGGNSVLGVKALSKTASNGIARLDAYVYLEGWDEHVIDSAISQSYSLSLTFEMGASE